MRATEAKFISLPHGYISHFINAMENNQEFPVLQQMLLLNAYGRYKCQSRSDNSDEMIHMQRRILMLENRLWMCEQTNAYTNAALNDFKARSQDIEREIRQIVDLLRQRQLLLAQSIEALVRMTCKREIVSC